MFGLEWDLNMMSQLLSLKVNGLQNAGPAQKFLALFVKLFLTSCQFLGHSFM